MIDSKEGFVDVYDSLFSINERISWHDYCTSLTYSPRGTDAPGYFDSRDRQLFRPLSTEEINTVGILKSPNIQEIVNRYDLKSYNINAARVNLSTPVERNNPHGDDCDITLLYYANMDWRISWGGQTLFFNKDMSKVELTSLYVPGRLLMFSGNIPHMIITPTSFSELYRYSIAIQFKKEKNDSQTA